MSQCFETCNNTSPSSLACLRYRPSRAPPRYDWSTRLLLCDCSNFWDSNNADRLDVYPQKTYVPISNQVQPIDPGDQVPGETTSRDPLIVIAPENPQQQHGEFCCSFCFALCCAILYASFVVRMRIEFNGHNSSVLVLFYSMR